VASVSECGEKATPETLISMADARLYHAKAEGRNRVISR
jgi:PleD family two-component response regulator